jgi:hypothetical protein
VKNHDSHLGGKGGFTSASFSKRSRMIGVDFCTRLKLTYQNIIVPGIILSSATAYDIIASFLLEIAIFNKGWFCVIFGYENHGIVE